MDNPDPKPNKKAQPGVIDKDGISPEKTQEEVLQDKIRSLSAKQIEQLQKAKTNKPAVAKRKTLSDYIRRDTTAVSLLQTANASYDQELNKYNVSFQNAGDA